MWGRILPAVLVTVAVACGGSDADSDTELVDPRVERADLARIKGDTSAPVWLVIVSDFQCPWCKRWHEDTGPQVLANYVEPGRVRIAYVHFPLTSIHPNAVAAAEASMCAAAQDRFWDFHDSLFATQDEWGSTRQPEPVFNRIAAGVGLDVAEYERCLQDDVMLPLIAADQQRFRGAGASSTPTFFIGGRMLEGAVPFESLAPILDSALAAASQPPR